MIRILFLYSIQRKYIFLPLLVLCLENWETYLYAWTLLGEIENLRLNEIPDIWNGLFLNIQPLLRILDGLEHTYQCFNLDSKPLAVIGICFCPSGCCGDQEWEDLIMYAWPPMFENAFYNITFISTEGALKLPMIYDDHPIPSHKASLII